MNMVCPLSMPNGMVLNYANHRSPQYVTFSYMKQETSIYEWNIYRQSIFIILLYYITTDTINNIDTIPKK